jgi:hypothetical protein
MDWLGERAVGASCRRACKQPREDPNTLEVGAVRDGESGEGKWKVVIVKTTGKKRWYRARAAPAAIPGSARSDGSSGFGRSDGAGAGWPCEADAKRAAAPTVLLGGGKAAAASAASSAAGPRPRARAAPRRRRLPSAAGGAFFDDLRDAEANPVSWTAAPPSWPLPHSAGSCAVGDAGRPHHRSHDALSPRSQKEDLPAAQPAMEVDCPTATHKPHSQPWGQANAGIAQPAGQFSWTRWEAPDNGFAALFAGNPATAGDAMTD